MTPDDDPLYGLFDPDFEPIPLSSHTGDIIKIIGLVSVIACFAAAIFVGEGS